MTTPSDDQLQAAAQHLADLVTLAHEGATGEPDLHNAIAQLDADQLAATLAVAAATIAHDEHRDTQLLEHGAATNRTLRTIHDRYRDGLYAILATTSSTRVRRIVTDALHG